MIGLVLLIAAVAVGGLAAKATDDTVVFQTDPNDPTGSIVDLAVRAPGNPFKHLFFYPDPSGSYQIIDVTQPPGPDSGPPGNCGVIPGVPAGHDGIGCTAFGSTEVATIRFKTSPAMAPTSQSKLVLDNANAPGARAYVVTGPVKSPSPATPPKWIDRKKLKEFARREARQAIFEALKECGALALSAHGLAAALAAGAASLGPAAGEGAEVSAMAEQVWSQLDTLKTLTLDNPIEGLQGQADACSATLVWFAKAYRTFKDPADADYTSVALPAGVSSSGTPLLCARYRGRVRPACDQLVAADKAVALGTGGVTSTYAAISTAADRASGAFAAGDAGAVSLQQAALRALHLELALRLRSLAAAEHSLAQQLHRYFASAALPMSASDRIRRYVNQRLVKLGLPAGDLAAFAPAPGNIALVSLLEQPQAVAGATGIGNSITLSDIAALLASFAANRQLSGPQQSQLGADLAAAEKAPNTAASKLAMQRFAADAKNIPGELGTLLQAAARPLAGG